MAAPTALVAAPAPPKGTVKPISPDVQEPPRRKHGELRLPMNAIINRARPPPEASRKRKMEMDQGFVEVDFQPGEFPMGLVVDWSMALPVLSGVVPGSCASIFDELRPGLVLLAVNNIPLVLGAGRHEVESNMSVRPLSLLFEAPTTDLFEVKVPIAWQRSRKAAALDIAPGEYGLVDHLSANAKLGEKKVTNYSWTKRKPNSSNSQRSKAGQVTTAPTDDLLRTKMAPAVRVEFFEEHPERSPLSRFGDLNIMNPNPFSGEAKYRMAQTTSSPALLQGKPHLPQLPQASLTLQPASGKKEASRRGPAWGSWLRPGVRPDKTKLLATSFSGWQFPSNVHPDRFYESLLDEEKPKYGAGATAHWPLGHEMEYECRLDDMVLCSKVRDAYEVGFRGKKRDKPTATEQLLGGTGDSMRIRRIAKVEQVSCDNCGMNLADADKPDGRFFYYCRRCKRSGRRFELCIQCHVLEILQGEGKYSGDGFHPHYLKCQHRMLIRRQSLENAYPSSPHLHRVLCDLCGVVVVGRGTSDNARDKDQGSLKKAQELKQDPGKKAYIMSNEFYACPSCPEQTGLRFELCVPCATKLTERGRGMLRLETTL